MDTNMFPRHRRKGHAVGAAQRLPRMHPHEARPEGGGTRPAHAN